MVQVQKVAMSRFMLRVELLRKGIMPKACLFSQSAAVVVMVARLLPLVVMVAMQMLT